MSANRAEPAAASRSRRWSACATEPHVLFPTICTLVLLIIWGSTANIIKVTRTAGEQNAELLSRELAETYEAQVLRALREIDQALKVVRYAHETGGQAPILQELHSRDLLPPDLLFVVSIVNQDGKVIASTRSVQSTTVADKDFFIVQKEEDSFAVGRPDLEHDTPGWTLRFSRRVDAPDGSFAGIVMLSVDAAYFVSGYDPAKLGEQGVLALLGTDGVFRIGRSGDREFAGLAVDYAAVVPTEDDPDTRTTLSLNAWDGVWRFTRARELYGVPLAVVVGVSANEQLAGIHELTATYRWRAAAASMVVVLVILALGRMSRQLALSRQRIVEEHIAHAERVEQLAYHDALTGLPNRSLFSKLLEQSIHEAQRYGKQLAVLFLDLDGFKRVNDSLGHEAGDALLCEVATRIGLCLRDSDIVSRLGGDEFVILLPDLEDRMYAGDVAEKILTTVARPVDLSGHEIRVTTSIGIATFPGNGRDEQTLIRSADDAMYLAKKHGKNNFRFPSDRDDVDVVDPLKADPGLREDSRRKDRLNTSA